MLLTLALLAGGLSAQTSQPQHKGGAIHGTVRNILGEPMAGVRVSAAYGGDPKNIMLGEMRISVRAAPTVVCATDESGRYHLRNLPAAPYRVRTDRDSTSATPHAIRIDGDEDLTLDLVVPASPQISGRVLDENGKPAVDAFVWLLKPELVRGVLNLFALGPFVTHKDGSYSIAEELESDRRYFLLADRDIPKDIESGEAIAVPTYYPTARRMDLSTAIELTPGENRQKVDIRIASAPVYCVAGKIHGTDFYKIQDEEIAGSRIVRVQGVADAQGSYSACGLAAGTYHLIADRTYKEFTIFDANLEHVDLSTELPPFRVSVAWSDPAEARPQPKFDERTTAALRSLASAAGLGDALSDDELADVARRTAQGGLTGSEFGHQLSAMDVAERRSLMGTLLNRGTSLSVTLSGAYQQNVEMSAQIPSSFDLAKGILPGDYTVDAALIGLTAYVKEINYGGVNVTDGIVHVLPGVPGTLQLRLARDVSTLAVKVTDSEGNPVLGSTVIAVPDRATTADQVSQLAVRGQTDQMGNYSPTPVAPGKYRVLATSQSIRWNVPEDLEKVMAVLFQASSVEVQPNGSAQITVQPIPIY
ncbi:MAG TPA: carboxypeptidase-like regulatory domain-containing protein [Bryobacteraceae bacterium]|nr:carboxypeptidase-like regulatory domain-containing protein [Bryobacteraceae bacterium]